MKTVLLLCALVITLGFSLFILVIKQENTRALCGTPTPQFICGTKSLAVFNLNKNAIKGKSIFNTNCAACHKLDKRMTGPALRHLSEKYDSITLYKYIQGKPTKLLNRTNSTFTCTFFPQLTQQDIANLIEYTN